MVARKFLKKALHWPAFFLCIFSIGSASVSLGDQPAGVGPSAARSEKVGCLTPTHSPRPAPLKVSGEVTASWYGPRHHNKLTANGQRFNMYRNTLAHRTLPLGTKVRLVNRENGKSAEGIVNDRGPYIKGRDVDVSYAMAQQLGFVKKGVTKLDIDKLWVAGKHIKGVDTTKKEFLINYQFHQFRSSLLSWCLCGDALFGDPPFPFRGEYA